eukprot:g12074.t1
MAWVNNNKRNARFNPNRRDDRLLDAEVTARRQAPVKPQKDEKTIAIEQILQSIVEVPLAQLLQLIQDLNSIAVVAFQPDQQGFCSTVSGVHMF